MINNSQEQPLHTTISEARINSFIDSKEFWDSEHVVQRMGVWKEIVGYLNPNFADSLILDSKPGDIWNDQENFKTALMTVAESVNLIEDQYSTRPKEKAEKPFELHVGSRMETSKTSTLSRLLHSVTDAFRG